MQWISKLLGVLLLVVPDADGWVPVEQPTVVQEDVSDEGGWVLFSLTLGGEKFWVKFPKEPTYSYTSDGVELRADCEEKGIFQLRVSTLRGKNILQCLDDRKKELEGVLFLQELVDPELGQAHLEYRTEGVWISEDLQVTPQSLYLFQTQQLDWHQHFVSSLQVFQNRAAIT